MFEFCFNVFFLNFFTYIEATADLENGYLTISAEKGLDKDEQEKETGRYIRKERYAGACSRSFYVGKEVEKEDIKADQKGKSLRIRPFRRTDP